MRAPRFRIAHLSDPHLGPLPPPPLSALASKRVFGYLNWLKSRRRALGSGILTRLLDDMRATTPDHIAVTGDLVNIALADEFANAARWLAALGPPGSVSVVPGNHDAYVPGAAARAARAWARYVAPEGEEVAYPTVRRYGRVALIGVSTAVATPPFFASGRVGASQRLALATLLDRHDDAVKIVMMHHPPDRELARGRRGLDDVDAVREVLSAGCADLVLHGHTHRPSLTHLATARGRAAVLGVPSASSDGSHHPLAGYALIDVDAEPGAIRIVRRGIARPDGPFEEVERIALRAGPVASSTREADRG